jgi:hypothetical protein
MLGIFLAHTQSLFTLIKQGKTQQKMLRQHAPMLGIFFAHT